MGMIGVEVEEEATVFQMSTMQSLVRLHCCVNERRLFAGKVGNETSRFPEGVEGDTDTACTCMLARYISTLNPPPPTEVLTLVQLDLISRA